MHGALIFDLDGTLVDSAPDIADAANRMLAEAGVAPLELETIIGFVGAGLPKLVERVIAHVGLDPGRHGALSARMQVLYAQAPAARARLYPGLPEALHALRAQGWRLGLCTNKPEAPARAILAAFGLTDLFEVVVGGDTLVVRKPDPAPLRHGFAALGAPMARLYVGDSETDAETARRAGLPFLLFTEGYRKSPPEALPHAARFDDFARLPALAAPYLR